MKIEFTTVEKYVKSVRQMPGVVVISIAMGISISLFANDGTVAAMPQLQYDTNRQMIELVDNFHTVSVPTAETGNVCYILNSNEENTADKLLASFAKLQIEEKEAAAYGETFAKMSIHISSFTF